MANSSKAIQNEIQELHHEAWPHFRAAFFAVFVLFSAYLSVVFLSGGGHVGMGH